MRKADFCSKKGGDIKLKILIVNTCSYKRNGITTVIINFFRAMDKTGLQIDFVATNQNTDAWFKEEVSKSGSQFYTLDRSTKHLIRYIRQLYNIMRHYDVVHAHGNSGTLAIEMLAAKKANVKLRIAHSHSTTCTSKIADQLLKPVLYRCCNGRLACGKDAGKWLFGKRTFEVINNGIDSKKYAFNADIRESIRKKLSLNQEKVIGHVGGFFEAKNHVFLIQLFEKIYLQDKSYKLLLIGDGERKEEVEYIVEKKGLKEAVIFIGSVPNVNEYLNAMDLIVMPSLYEGIPLTLIEEQANGLPCIVSDGITKEVDKTGLVQFLSLNDDSQVWIDAIRKTISSKKRERASLDAIESIQSSGYDIQNQANRLKNYYLIGK